MTARTEAARPESGCSRPPIPQEHSQRAPRHSEQSNGLRVSTRSNAASFDIAVGLDTDGLYPVFVARALADWRSGNPPIAGLAELEAAMKVVDAGHASNAAGKPMRPE